MHHGVILLPGIITPAEVAFADLRSVLLGVAVKIVLKDLAIYDSETPPVDYSFENEIAAVLDIAAVSGLARFHLVGYSAGGAISAAFAARHPDRLVSLTLMEPAWLGDSDMSEGERRAHMEVEEAAKLPPNEALPKFARLNLAPGVLPPPPPPGAPPPWMAKRPAGIRAIGPAFRQHHLDAKELQRFPHPVLYVLGGLSNPALYRERAERARRLFSDFALEVFEDRHHFDPPHRAEPQRLAKILQAFWARAEAGLRE